MSEIKDHRGLEAWQVAMDAVMETYAVSSDFPKSEIYGLAGQMRRAAVSVPSNVAEGYVEEVERRSTNWDCAWIDRGTGHATGSGGDWHTSHGSSGAPSRTDRLVRRLVNGLRRARRLKLDSQSARQLGSCF